MSSRGGRQKQMMNVVPPITSTQRQQTQQPLQPPQRQQVQQRQPPPPPPLQTQQTQQTQQKQQKQQKPKMTIGDAIGLITIRLGRVEQFLQQLQTDGIDMSSINSTQPNDFMDNGLIQNLVSRLNTIEEYSTNTATNSDTNPATEQRIKNMETDLRETKDLLMKLILKFENFSDDTLPKFEQQQQQITLNLEKIQQLQQESQEQQQQQQQITLNLEKIQQEQQEQQEPQEQLLNQYTSEEALPTPSNESESVP